MLSRGLWVVGSVLVTGRSPPSPLVRLYSVVARMYQKGERRRDEILQATLRVIGARGADAVTHRAVAEEAGVPLSATTYYFASKEELLEQTLLMAAREETARLERLGPQLAPRSLSVQGWAAAVA